jgi:UPF0755 protein
MEDITLPDIHIETPKNKRRVYLYMGGGLFLILLLYFFAFSAPAKFPTGTIVNIGSGAGLHNVSGELKAANIIRSRTVFEAIVIMYGGEKHIIPADYLFDVHESVWSVARRISKGDRHLAPVKITIPEGFDNGNIADLFASKLSTFNKDKFLELAKAKQGFLFPDTYFFFTTDNENDALKSLGENYEKKVGPLRDYIFKLGKTENEIISMAAIIEGEAEGKEDRDIISGILWRRIKIGMPLQVDTAPITYKERGIPKAPISNPGLDAVKAAMYPVKTDYLYYIHDKEGNVHFAKNFAEHQANIVKYLKS